MDSLFFVKLLEPSNSSILRGRAAGATQRGFSNDLEKIRFPEDRKWEDRKKSKEAQNKHLSEASIRGKIIPGIIAEHGELEKSHIIELKLGSKAIRYDV